MTAPSTPEPMFGDLGLEPQTVVVPRFAVGHELRDAGIEQVWSGTNEQWRHVALDALYRRAVPTADAGRRRPVAGAAIAAAGLAQRDRRAVDVCRTARLRVQDRDPQALEPPIRTRPGHSGERI